MSAEVLAGAHASQGHEPPGGTMLSSATLESLEQPSRPLPYATSWEMASCSIRRAAEVEGVADAVAASMADAGYSDRDVDGMRAALEEALRKALPSVPAAEVRAFYLVSPVEALAEVCDAQASTVTLRKRRSPV
jgi:hypothetical protein